MVTLYAKTGISNQTPKAFPSCNIETASNISKQLASSHKKSAQHKLGTLKKILEK
jgi:hypothetical protein